MIHLYHDSDDSLYSAHTNSHWHHILLRENCFGFSLPSLAVLLARFTCWAWAIPTQAWTKAFNLLNDYIAMTPANMLFKGKNCGHIISIRATSYISKTAKSQSKNKLGTKMSGQLMGTMTIIRVWKCTNLHLPILGIDLLRLHCNHRRRPPHHVQILPYDQRNLYPLLNMDNILLHTRYPLLHHLQSHQRRH